MRKGMQAPIRVGIIGANHERGWAFDAHLPALRHSDRFVISAVAARSQTSAKQAAGVFGAARSYGNANDLAQDPEIDLVVVAVRVQEHAGPVLACLRAHKHVYCEWPLGRTLEEAEELAASVPTGTRAIVGAQVLSAPAVRQAIKLISDGAIGAPRVLRAYNTAAPWGSVASAGAYLQDNSSGGTLATIGMGHILPAIEAMAGAYFEIDARSTIRYPQVRIEGADEIVQRNCADHILALGLHSSGCVSTLEVIGGRSERPALIEVVGDRGWLRIIGAHPGTLQIAPLAIEASFALDPLPTPTAPGLSGPSANLAEVYNQLALDFENGEQTLPSFADAVRITRLIGAIENASIAGRRIALSASGGALRDQNASGS